MLNDSEGHSTLSAGTGHVCPICDHEVKRHSEIGKRWAGKEVEFHGKIERGHHVEYQIACPSAQVTGLCPHCRARITIGIKYPPDGSEVLIVEMTKSDRLEAQGQLTLL